MLFPIEKGEQIDEKLIQRTLSPYSNKGTIYLQEARRVFKVGDSICSDVNSDKKYLVMGQFSIGESCYIDDTGHLNAVEFNICYNQLLYVAIAWGCDQQKLDCFQELTLENFYIKQLPNVLITRMESNFKRVINASNFSGLFGIKKAKKTRKMIILKTEIEFVDDHNGLAYGEVDVVIT